MDKQIAIDISQNALLYIIEKEEEFYKFVDISGTDINNIRNTELINGSFDKFITRSEKKNLTSIKKNLVYRKDITKGIKISANDLISIRSDTGISAVEYCNIINKTLIRSVKKNTIVKKEDFRSL